MYSDWSAQAQMKIAAVIKDLPDDATLEDMRKALRAASGSFHHGTSWGKKVWPRECRKYLAMVARAPAKPALGFGHGKQHDEMQAKIAAGDIVFPFRKS